MHYTYHTYHTYIHRLDSLGIVTYHVKDLDLCMYVCMYVSTSIKEILINR